MGGFQKLAKWAQYRALSSSSDLKELCDSDFFKGDAKGGASLCEFIMVS